MAIQNIVIGTPGAGGGDPAHAAFKKINDNTTELYDAAIPDTEAKKAQARANLDAPSRSEVPGLGQSYVAANPISGVTYYNTSPAMMLIFLAIPTTALVSGFVNNMNVVNFGGVAFATNIMAVPAGASYRFENPTNATIVIYYELR